MKNLKWAKALFILLICCVTSNNACLDAVEYNLFEKITSKKELETFYELTTHLSSIRLLPVEEIFKVPFEKLNEQINEIRIPFEIYADIELKPELKGCLFSINSNDMPVLSFCMIKSVENGIEMNIERTENYLPYNISSHFFENITKSKWVKLIINIEKNYVTWTINCETKTISTDVHMENIPIPNSSIVLGKDGEFGTELYNGWISDLRIYFHKPDSTERRCKCLLEALENNDSLDPFTERELEGEGKPGQKGDQGIPGIDGKPGPPGKGDKGNQGVKGPQGFRGKNGENGAKGEPGTKGEKGERGQAAEEPIIREIKGMKGAKGDTGSKGDKGEAAVIDKEKLKGEKGEKGEIGKPGYNGTCEKAEPSIHRGYGKPGGLNDDDDLVVAQSIVFETFDELLKRTAKIHVGTIVFVLQGKKLLLRVQDGWHNVETREFYPQKSNNATMQVPYNRTSSTNVSTTTEASNIPTTTKAPNTPTRIKALNLFTTTKDPSILKTIHLVALNEPYPGNMLLPSNSSGRSLAEQMCYNEAREAGLNGTFAPVLCDNAEDLRSILKNPADRFVPVVNLQGLRLYDSWVHIFLDAPLKSNIYSFNGKNVHIDNTNWPMKAIWHGSNFAGYNDYNACCAKWQTDSHLSIGAASPLFGNLLRNRQPYPCDSKLIVLCVETTSNAH